MSRANFSSRTWRRIAAAGAVVAGGIALPTSVPTVGAVPPPPGATVVGLVAGPECPTPIAPPIQAVIDAAAPGATIFICAGTYTEQLTINKPLTLLGAQWGVDARTGRTDPAAETVFNVPAGAIVYATGATTGTLDGFTLTGATGIAVSGIGNGTADAYTFQNNIVTANAVGFNFHTVVGPGTTLIQGNRFVANTGPNPSDGSSIFVTNGFVHGMTVQDNLFQGNTGPSAANINTPGAATPSSGILIQNNTSDADQTFAVINNTTGTQVLNNTILDAGAVAPAGSAIVLFSANPGAVISGNTIDGGIGLGIGDVSGSTGPITIANNTITGRTAGIRLSQVDATVADNTVINTASTGAAGTGIGIWMQVASAGATISGNDVSGSAVLDCQDDSVGTGTAGTANTWTTNIGATSSPVGLCQLPPPTTTTTTTTTTAPASTTTTTTPPATSTTSPMGVTTTSVRPSTPGQGTLPATGDNSPNAVMWLGLVLLAFGVLLTRLSRRV